MKRIILACVAAILLSAAGPASAVTNDNGIIVFTQTDAINGNVTPGDTPGFPVTISVGGSYRLGSNLTVTSPVNGIEVRANEVTIDMAGFTLAGSGAGRNGIASFNRSLRVAHGNIRGFTNDGIRTIAQYLSVADMLITGSGRNGIYADPSGISFDAVGFASIVNSKVTANGNAGIVCENYCRVENSLSSNNFSIGISCHDYCRIGNSIAAKNRNDGIYCSSYCSVENNTASANHDGIFIAGAGGSALGNTATANSNDGIHFLDSGGAGNNTVLGNGFKQIEGPYIAMQPNACPECD